MRERKRKKEKNRESKEGGNADRQEVLSSFIRIKVVAILVLPWGIEFLTLNI